MRTFLMRLTYHYRFYRRQLGWGRLHSLQRALTETRTMRRCEKRYKGRLWPR